VLCDVAVKPVPVTVTENTPVGIAPDPTPVIAGGTFEIIVTVAVAVWLPVPVAVIVAVGGLGTCEGAVYRPAPLILPADAVHVTACAAPLSAAENCCVPPYAIEIVFGEIVRDPPLPPPPPPALCPVIARLKPLENMLPGLITLTCMVPVL
jgi:hypothetical protein